MIPKTVLITGSSKGLGRSLAFNFAANKYNIILHGRNQPAMAEVADEVLSKGVVCDAVLGDLSSEKTIHNLYEVAVKRDLDILINNAGIYAHKPFTEMSAKELRRIIEVNLIAPALLTMRIYPMMKRRKSGTIINISSMAATVANELEAAYCASKHGLRGFTRSFRYEATRHGVRMISISLGAMRTSMTAYREDHAQLIDPFEVAVKVFNACKESESLTVEELSLRRKR
jgi:3-oxoacyl-[acyl-carrier protein] reductase